jgi:hypothetical protein
MPTISSGLTAALAGLTTAQTAFQALLSSLPDGVADLETVQSITSQLSALAAKYQGS